MQWRTSRWEMPWRIRAWPGQRRVGLMRRFISREERIASLEQYLKALEGEAQGVRERLAELGGSTEGAK